MPCSETDVSEQLCFFFPLFFFPFFSPFFFFGSLYPPASQHKGAKVKRSIRLWLFPRLAHVHTRPTNYHPLHTVRRREGDEPASILYHPPASDPIIALLSDSIYNWG